MQQMSLYEFEIIFSKKLKEILQTPEFNGDDYYIKKLFRCITFSQWETFVADHILTYFKDKKILEIGCGAGQLSIYLKLKGVDIECCEAAHSRYKMASIMSEYFMSGLTIYEKKYQDYTLDDLLKFDILIGGDITNTLNNNFMEDKKILDNFLNDSNKFILFDGSRYNYCLNDYEKYDMENFFLKEKDRLFNYTKYKEGSLFKKCKIL